MTYALSVLDQSKNIDSSLEPLDEYTRKVVQARQRGTAYPYEIVKMLTSAREEARSEFPPGDFVEYDLDAQGQTSADAVTGNCPVCSALRWRGSTWASSLACRTSSGVTLPVGAPRSTRAATAGCDSTSAGSILRAFEDTNTSRQLTWGRGEAR